MNKESPKPMRRDAILDPWIIEEIRKREKERIENEDRPRVEIADDPSKPPAPSDRIEIAYDDPENDDGKKRDRGVVIIDLKKG